LKSEREESGKVFGVSRRVIRDETRLEPGDRAFVRWCREEVGAYDVE
jgi:hypothetical protein